MINTLFEQVCAQPYPELDQATTDNPYAAEQQYSIYQEVLQLLQNTFSFTLNEAQQADIEQVCHATLVAIPAGAGSGKTRVLVSVIIALLRLGIPAHQIHCISFTNASANDLQGKFISESISYLAEQHESESSFKPQNINCGTIHKHAIDMLKHLEPHVGGVGYYFEDASQSTVLHSQEDDKSKATKKSLLLSLYASIYYHAQMEEHHGLSLSDSLSAYIKLDSQKKQYHKFIIPDLHNEDLLEQAHAFINEESLSDAGLGAFTNIDNTNPDYIIAVATDALLRLAIDSTHFSQDDKFELLRLPKYLMLDEAQDIDLIQILYIRALALNGTNIIMVGDPRQTLYEFRHALSEWGFEDNFLKSMFANTPINTHITTKALTTNYRSRKEILDLAETLSERMVYYAAHEAPADAKYIHPINDPKESVKKSICHKPSLEIEQQNKALPAVNVIVGEISDKHQWLLSSTNDSTNDVSATDNSSEPKRPLGLARLQKQLTKADDKKKAQRLTNTHIECKKFQLPSLCGGKHSQDIEDTFVDIYKRSLAGDSVGILLKNNPYPEDKNYLKNLIKSHESSAFEDNQVIITQTGNERYSPLGTIDYLTDSLDMQYGVPFTSLMIAAAIHYFFSWDKEIKKALQENGVNEINWIIPAQTLEQVAAKNKKHVNKKSIELELTPFFETLIIHKKEVLPETSLSALKENQDSLIQLFASFIESVLYRYGRLFWKSSTDSESFAKQQPCRFQGCVALYDKIVLKPRLRHTSESRRFFRLMWQAIASTPFNLGEQQRKLLSNLSIPAEWIEADTTLTNYPELLVNYKDRQLALNADSVTTRIYEFDTCIKQRERLHEQFSKIYHHKTRTYLREVASTIGRIVRHNMSDDAESILRLAYDEGYMTARNMARTNTWFKGDADKKKSYGLFNDMLSGVKDIDVQMAPKSNRNISDETPQTQSKIEFSTIHSSKGLEWDHVILVFPKASANDKDTSFKAARDLLYVAITRAKKTLTILINKEKNVRPSATNTCFKVASQLLHECANELGLKNKAIAFDDLKDPDTETEQASVTPSPLICIETSHSEIEKAATCRIHHYIQHNRRLSSMNPLAQPSYAFFFHSTLSSICATISGQRIELSDDPIVEIADFIRSLADQPIDDEYKLYQQLNDNLLLSCNSVMQTMVPMYYLVGEDRFVNLINYYATQFLKQLASIMIGSELFKNIIVASRLPGHKILIEKSLRVLESIDNHTQIYLPIYGIPDIIISGDKINYIADYKTMPVQPLEEQPLSTDTLIQISQKTAQQLNFYQGMSWQLDKQSLSEGALADKQTEIIYVADLTVPEYQDIPQESPTLPVFVDSPEYAVAHREAAIILTGNQFNHQRYQTTLNDIDHIRLQTEHYGEHLESSLFEPQPIDGLSINHQVTEDLCRACSSKIHCQKNLASELMQGIQ